MPYSILIFGPVAPKKEKNLPFEVATAAQI
jgi:hypothetical protein